MQNVLITGGAGYIGSHVALEFLNAGYGVAILDNFSNSEAKTVETLSELSGKAVGLHQIDIRDQSALDTLFQSHKFEGVIHCAGLKAVGESVQFPLKYYDNNVTGTLCLLRAMEKANVSKIVFSSSATIYGKPQYLPIDENHPQGPINPYGNTKLMVEWILEDLENSGGAMRSAILRYFNPAGAHKSGRLGERPKGIPANLVPFISQVASGQREALNVWGDDYDTADGTGVRDYIHILDLANAHLKAFEHITAKDASVLLNIGTGIGYSVMEMIKAFEAASGKSLTVNMSARRPGDVAACFAKVDLAADVIGWKAKYGLKDMCEDQWRWECSNV